jgi:hypothetical protein
LITISRQIVVEILGDSDKFSKSIDAASGKTKSFSNVVKGIGMGIGTAAFDLAAGAVSAFVSTLDDAAAAYREDQVSQAKMGQALKNNIPGWDGNTKAIEKLIGAQMRLGFSDEEQRDSLSLLVGSTNDVEKAQKLQAAAMDLARLKGISLADATDIMLKANEGNFKGLKSVGISLDANATSADAYAAVLALAGGQAETFAATSEGKQLAAQLKVGESMEKIGEVVNNVSAVALPILADAFTNIIDVLSQVWAAVEPVVQMLMKELQPAFDQVAKMIKVVINEVQKHIPAAMKVAEVAFNVIKNNISIFINVMKILIDIFMKIANVTIPIFMKAVEILVNIISTGFNATKAVVTGLINHIVNSFNNVVNFFSTVGKTISNVVGGMWDGIWKAFKGVINLIIKGWNSLKFTVPSIDMGPLGKIGGFTIGTPNIPYLHQGGIVPGSSGQDVLAILQAGERVIPRNKASGGGDIHIHIDQGAYIDGPSIDRLANIIAKRMKYASGV